MWPNTLQHKALGTMEAIAADDAVKLVIGKRYFILDLRLVDRNLHESEFNYLVQDENSDYVWANQKYLKGFIPK